jgi:hypothetical protein
MNPPFTFTENGTDPGNRDEHSIPLGGRLMIKTDEVAALVCSGRELPFRTRVVKSAMY